MSRDALPTISCIIPALNEEKRIGGCIKSILTQSYPGDRIEILVVDDDSTDGTVAIASSLGARILRNGEHSIERGKSIGAENARGDYILLLDADNALPDKGWLASAVNALLDHPEAVGAQAAWFHYAPDDYTANRYCALFGINDPFAFYLKKRDKLTHYEKGWSIAGELIKTTDEYFLVKFDTSSMPTIGSQGFLISRKDILSTNHSPLLFHMEMNLELIERGRDVFIMLRRSVIHEHCRTVRELLNKMKRNFSLFLEQRAVRAYRWETTLAEKAVALVSMLTLVRPSVASIRGYIRLKDPAWLLHPVICFLVPVIYGFLFIKWLVARGFARMAWPRGTSSRMP